MIPAPIPENEAERLATLRRFAILDSKKESAFDRITNLASELFDAPIALISLIDSDRQWFKASCGLEAPELPRDLAFCAYTILEDGVLCVPDTTQDKRFKDNPFVTCEVPIKFYCGAPLVAQNGHRLGSLCIVDTKTRHDFGKKQQQRLADLAAIVVDQMDMRSVTGSVLEEIECRQEAQNKAAATESQIRALIQHVPNGIALMDMNGKYLACSDTWRDFMALLDTNAASDGIGGLSSSHPVWYKAYNDALAGKTTRVVEDPVRLANGEVEYLRWEARPWKSQQGKIQGVVASSMQVTKQVAARKTMARQAEMLNAVLENIKDGVVACDAEGSLTLFNQSGRSIHGIDQTCPLGGDYVELTNLFEADGITPLSDDRNPLFEAMKGGSVVDREMVIAPDGLPKRHVIAQAAPLRTPDDKLIGAVASMTDVTSAKLAERQLRASEANANYIAFHDTLTGLPNRAHFGRMVENTKNSLQGQTTAAFFLDLNQFKAVNDLCGHKVGDDLLKRTAKLLKRIVGKDAFVSRLGGDEFIIFKPVVDREAALQLGNEMAHAIGQPLVIGGYSVVSGVSVGIAMHPAHGDTHEELMRRADLAMYKSKASGKNEPVMFDPVFELETVKRRVMKQELSKAIENKELEVYLQPIVDAQTQEVIGAEALARWNHPSRGLILPNEFIPIAEESGFIVELGDWVLRSALKAIAPWSELFLSVNLSPVQFKDPRLAERVFDALEATRFDPRRLELEVTEGLLIYDTKVARRAIDAFKSKGIQIALDDFGTGYSSLGYIQNFPFDKVKIDRSFVADIDTNPQSAAVVQCVVNLASSLGMVVTAEGIETERHELLLKFIGCNTLQGFKYGRPLPVAEFGLLPLDTARNIFTG